MQWNVDFDEEILQGCVNEMNDMLPTGSVIRFLTGTPPALPSDAETGTLVAEVELDVPAWGPIGGGNVSQMSAVDPVLAVASGTITYARVVNPNPDCIIQFTCGTGSEDIVFDDNVFTAGDVLVVSIIPFTWTLGPT